MKFLPNLSNILWTIISATLLVFAFPNYEFWFLAFVALIPFFYAINQEKVSKTTSFVLGWIWGISFLFGSCWWIAFPMIETAGIPKPIAYFIALCVTIIAGLFSGLYGLFQSILLKRFGVWALMFAPFIWVFTEFLRFWLTGNNWNAIGYSQAFTPLSFFFKYASVGGVLLVSFVIVTVNVTYGTLLLNIFTFIERKKINQIIWLPIIPLVLILISTFIDISEPFNENEFILEQKTETKVIAIQPNVPMSGLKFEDWKRLRKRHVELAESAIKTIPQTEIRNPSLVIFPESPMNFEYAKDAEMREFFKDFTTRNNVKVLFNSAEPVYPEYLHREPYTLNNQELNKSLDIYNSAVLIDETGKKIAQYDKIHLLPFGEFIPLPKFLADYVPPVVGNFTFGKEYDILPINEINAGVMICFESHFPSHSRKFAENNVDILIEITNDGYLGNTPVLRQHLANAIFRAVETNRPVLRVTNAGITALIDEKGTVIKPTESFAEDTRIWTISKSNKSQTFYVKYGNWLAWLCSAISLMLLFWSFRKQNET